MTLSPQRCNQLTIPSSSWGNLHDLKVTVTSQGPNKYSFIAERTEKDLLGPLTIEGTFTQLNDRSALEGKYTCKTVSSDPEEGEFVGSYDKDKGEWRLHPSDYTYDATWTLSQKID